jgi:endo-1,4-beta-xylanase
LPTPAPYATSTLARQVDPGAALYIIDYSILSAGGNDVPHQNHYFGTIRRLEDSGAPVQGIGMQGHFSQNLTPPVRLWEILDRFGALNKPIQITEFDIDMADEQLQAAYTRDFLTAVFAHPTVKGFLMWGFREGRHWRPTSGAPPPAGSPARWRPRSARKDAS